MAANQLVGNYSTTEHSTCLKLRHGCLNHIFELAGMNCRSRGEPITRAPKKWRGSIAELPPPTRRAKKRKRKKISFRLGDWTSEREKSLAKSMKQSQKFSIANEGTQSSGLDVTEKTSLCEGCAPPIVGGKTSGQKMSLASAAGGDVGYASAHTLRVVQKVWFVC
jgi:hypothetical protein